MQVMRQMCIIDHIEKCKRLNKEDTTLMLFCYYFNLYLYIYMSKKMNTPRFNLSVALRQRKLNFIVLLDTNSCLSSSKIPFSISTYHFIERVSPYLNSLIVHTNIQLLTIIYVYEIIFYLPLTRN
jgi:hypothetical protein